MIKEIDWFEVGRSVFKEDVRDPDFFPPLHDMEAQRQWLGGFGAAWAEAPNDDESGESVNDALVRALAQLPHFRRMNWAKSGIFSDFEEKISRKSSAGF